MKKFFKWVITFALVLTTCLTFAGCTDKVFSPTTNDCTAVSNGGIALYYDEWLYFINGTRDNTVAENKTKSVIASIYRVKTDKDGKIRYKTSGKESEENKDGEFLQMELVVSSLTGFDDGSIYFFGNYIYYATPCTDKNRDGEMLIGKTVFKRYDLVNKHEQVLYKTASSDDTIKYTYLVQGDTLNLVVYETNAKTLRSLRIDTKVTENFVKNDVTACIFSENLGQATAGGTTDTYIYYSLNYDEDATIKRGNRIFRISPNGENEKQLKLREEFEGESVTLLTIREDYLLYSLDSYIYGMKITADTEYIELEDEYIVSYASYENVIYFTTEDGKMCSLVYNESYISTLQWDGNSFIKTDLRPLPSGTTLKFIGTYEDFVIYSVSGTIYKTKYKNIAEDEENDAITICKTTTNDANGLMVPEIFNGYVYFFNTDSNTKKTYLFRADLKITEDNKEEAEFIGVRE